MLALDDSARLRRSLGRLLFAGGLILWLSVQGALMLVPLWTRALPPEVDDSLTYVLKSVQMEECFKQDCPALQDLRRQHYPQGSEAQREKGLADSRIFPVYHPLLSLMMVGLKKLGLGWMATYKAVWTVGPVFFALAFAYLLATLWGLPAAGIALSLLAFKVFPDTGLQRVVPSNLAMGMAVLIWARIISCNGSAIWTLIVGSLLMMAMHPIGRIYAVMAAVLALSVSGLYRDRRAGIAALSVLFLVILAFLVFKFAGIPGFVDIHILPSGKLPLLRMIMGAGESAWEILGEILRLEGGLFGSFALFCGVTVMGFLTTPQETRSPAAKIVLIYLAFLFAILFYVSDHPGDVFFRMWIPLVVVLFGAVGRAIWYALGQTWGLTVRCLKGDLRPGITFQSAWPVALLAVLLGYSLHMMVMGGEQVYATEEFMRHRQPLDFKPTQPRLLLEKARQGDRVLYTSMMVMPYYFIHGAMKLGAVYYHSAMQGTKTAKEWLNRPDLHFAVTYNPTVYHPTFEGVQENRWWITDPAFRYTPLYTPRTNRPISMEGTISSSRFRHIDIVPKGWNFPGVLRLLIKNMGKGTEVRLLCLDRSGTSIQQKGTKAAIPAGFHGWIRLPLKDAGKRERFRIILPARKPGILIGGIVFGNDKHRWPWAQKARLTFMPVYSRGGPITVSFDPADILPAPLGRKKISVLDDSGSSVLFRIDQ